MNQSEIIFEIAFKIIVLENNKFTIDEYILLYDSLIM